jgi:LysR family glycine cleavage system transcriptional activator
MTSPPLHTLRAFTAAARWLSFTRAAAELHVTQTAISHQMRQLEEHLGTRLFVRLPRKLQLTAQGRAYAQELLRVFERIDDATSALTAQPRREVLAITCVPSFAARWLVPRLGRFTALHPTLDVRLASTDRTMDLGREGIDVGIRFGYGSYAGLASERLLDDVCFPVCSPRLAGARKRRLGLRDLGRQTLLHDDSSDGWRRWLRAAGVAGDAERGHVFSDANLMLQAAADGLGVALARGTLVAHDLRRGVLVRPFAPEIPSEQAYFLVTPAGADELPRVRAFTGWLKDEARHPAAPAPRPRRR